MMLRQQLTDGVMFRSAYQTLTPAEQAYVDRYVEGVDAEAVRTGERMIAVLNARQMDATAVAASHGMLERQHVQHAIVERVDAITRDREIAPARVLNEYEAIGFANMRDYINIQEDGWIAFDFTKVSVTQWKAIKSFEIEHGKDGKVKFKVQLHDKMAALNMFARYMGLIDEDNPHWQAERSRRVGAPPTIPLAATATDAADAYSRILEKVGGAVH